MNMSHNFGLMPKNISLFRGIVLAFLAAAISFEVAKADQVTTAPGFGPYQIGSGGEFTMIPDAGVTAMLGAYSPFTMNYVQPGTFQTFCLEREVNISPNTTYNVVLNPTNYTLLSGKQLTLGAAYLYSQFATGALNYDYSDVPAGGRTTGTYSAYTLQHAIWYYMGEYGAEANDYYENLVNSMFANPFAASNGAFNVGVLNLWSGPVGTGDAQDMLILKPVPEPSSLALVGLAVAMVAGLRRKLT
jgi:hypothetical protein